MPYIYKHLRVNNLTNQPLFPHRVDKWLIIWHPFSMRKNQKSKKEGSGKMKKQKLLLSIAMMVFYAAPAYATSSRIFGFTRYLDLIGGELTTGALPSVLAVISIGLLLLGGIMGFIEKVPKPLIGIVGILAILVTLKNTLAALGLYSVVF